LSLISPSEKEQRMLKQCYHHPLVEEEERTRLRELPMDDEYLKFVFHGNQHKFELKDPGEAMMRDLMDNAFTDTSLRAHDERVNVKLSKAQRLENYRAAIVGFYVSR
jgi:hypothetical protein